MGLTFSQLLCFGNLGHAVRASKKLSWFLECMRTKTRGEQTVNSAKDSRKALQKYYE